MNILLFRLRFRLKKIWYWIISFQRHAPFGLRRRDLKQISKGDYTSLETIPHEQWIEALHSVPIPRRGLDSNLDLNALLGLCRRRIA